MRASAFRINKLELRFESLNAEIFCERGPEVYKKSKKGLMLPIESKMVRTKNSIC